MKAKLLTSAELFAGTSEICGLLREIDWEQTSLGPVETWPQSLKTSLRIMITSRQPIWVGWGDELIYFYNDAYKSIIGGKHPWALGKPVLEVWQEIEEEIEPMLATALSGDEGTYVEEQLLIMERNGYPEETYYTFSYSPIPDDDNTPGGIICANTDDTQRVIGERQLATLRHVAAQGANSKSLQTACENSMEGLCLNPRDLPFALLYIQSENLQGDTADCLELAGTVGFDAVHCAAPVLLEREHSIWPYNETLTSHQITVMENLSNLIADELPSGAWKLPPTKAAVLPVVPAGETGRAGVLIVGLNPYRLFDKNYQSFLNLIAGQISSAIANAQAYDEEKKRAEALAEIDKAKTVFFSNVSHEFRTPLTLMLGPLEEAMSNLVGNEDIKPDLQVAHRNGLRLLKLVNSLLDFSRVEAGRMQAAYSPYDLAMLTEDLASNFRSAYERAGLKLTIECARAPEPVYLDRDMWEKIVFNLLSNAFKFTFEGEVVVELTYQDRVAVLAIKDSGVGIAENELPYIFQRFHRVEHSKGRSHEGTGIGLALVKELVKLHGGDIAVQSQLNVGTTFIVKIPLGTSHLPPEQIGFEKSQVSTAARSDAFIEEALRWLPDADLREEELEAHSSVQPANEKAKILLADDNADMRVYIQRILKNGYQITAVGDGEVALSEALKIRPDLILSDVMMPRLDGFGLLKELKKRTDLQGIPVILLSARADEEAQIEAIDAGADDYLVKPFSAKELVARVKAQLAKDESRKEQENHFRTIADNSPAILWTTSPDAACTYLSKQWYEYTGGSPAEDLGFGWLGKVHKEDYDQAREIFLNANERQEPFRLEYRLRGIDGRYNWAIDAGSPRFDEDGNYLGFVGCVFDISERRRMETVLDGQKRALELGMTGAPLTYILEVFAKAVEKQSNSGVRVSILLVDEEERRLVHGAAPSLPETFIKVVDGVQISPNAGACGAAACRREPVFVSDIENDAICASIKEIALSHNLRACWSTPIFSTEGKLLATITLYYPKKIDAPDAEDVRVVRIFGSTAALIIDKTIDARLRKVADDKLRASEAALRDADKRKDEFLATLAHELRNPLAPISNALQIMQLTHDTASLKEMRELIARQTTQLVRLVDDLMDVSRITRGKVDLQKENVSLNHVINNAIEVAEPLINKREQNLTIIMPNQDIWLDADFTRLSQVFTNIINNAAKYTQVGGKIELAVKSKGGNATVSVRDNGRGIPADKLPYIFEMFTQVEDPLGRGHGGLGLGLTLAEQLIKMHGGTLTATSDGLEKGSCFTVRLPISMVQRKNKETHTPKEFTSNSVLRVLVVDDNLESANTLGELIKLFGHDVVTVHSGTAAIRVVESFIPDVVLLDIGMPDINGYEVCKLMKENPALKFTTFIAQTGWSEKRHHQLSQEVGFNHHLVKPVDMSVLKDLLEQVGANI